MRTKIWVGISTGPTETRVLVTEGATTLLKARLCRTPSHPRALGWLLEALALWQGAAVHAVLSVDDSGDESDGHFHRDWFPDFDGPLYALEVTDRGRPRCRDDAVGDLGDFGDLEQLHLFDMLESGR
jgi:hypothetical protein